MTLLLPLRYPGRISTILSLIVFLNTGLFSFILIFFPLYAESLGCNPSEIGILMVLVILATTAGHPLFLVLSVDYVTPRTLVISGSILSAGVFILMLYVNNLTMLGLLIFTFVLLKVGTSALFDFDILRRSAHGELRFERVRIWGSIGFIALGALLGILSDQFGIIDATKIFLIIVIIQSMLCVFFSNLLETRHSNRKGSLSPFNGKIFLQSKIFWLFISVALNWLAHAPFYVYLSLYLQAIGWNSTEISIAWNTGVLGEVLLFLFFIRLELRYSLSLLFIFGMFSTFLRLIIIANFASASLILFSQTLHAFSFGLCYLTSVRLCYDWFPEYLKEKSQAALSLIGVGLGGVVGRILVSYIARDYKDYQECINLFWIGSVFALMGTITAYLSARASKRELINNS